MAKNEAKIKFTAETKDFNDSIKKANDEMSELRAEMKLNDEQMKTTGKSVEALENKQKNLSEQLAASEKKTEALSQKVDKAAEIFGDNSTEVSKLRTQLLNAQSAEERIRQAIDACNKELDEQRSAAKEAASATTKLTNTIDDQQSELNRLKKEYADAVLEYGKNSDEAKKLKRSIKDLSGELADNQEALGKAESAADKLDKSFKDAGDAAEKSGDGFTVLGGVVADLASKAIQEAIGKMSEFLGYLAQLPAETLELRQDFATLTTSFDNVGFSTEEATQTWKDLYAVFGEEDRAVEAANLIAKMSDDQKDLSDWVTITTGIFGTYQDSLPVEGLAEASMETAKVGQVTGALADALNWSSEAATMFAGYMSEDVTTAEDAFNEALKECSTEEERQALITETLTKLYGGAADTYRDTAGAQMEAKEATAEHMLVENDLASSLEPVTTAWQEMKTILLDAVAPAVEKVSELALAALDWMNEHPTAVKAIAAAVSVLAIGLGGLAAAWGIYTVAQWAANSAMLASPITWVIAGVIAAIAAVVAIAVVVVEHWEQVKAFFSDLWEGVKNAASTAWEWIKGIWTSVANWFNTNVIQPVVNFFKGLWESLKSIWDTICNVVKVAIMFIGSLISAAFQIITLPFRMIWENCKETIMTAWNAIKNFVTSGINAVKSVITTVMNAIKNVFSTVWNAIKNAVTTVVNAIKNVVSRVWNSIKSVTTSVWNGIKSAVSNVWNGIKSGVSNAVNRVKTTVSNVFNSIKSTATNVWNGIKSAITKPIEAAKDKVKSVIDAIKGFFSNLKLKLPNIKLPHFSIEGKLSLNPPSVPKLKIDWYKEGGILTKPTIFGMNGNRLMAGGEAGAEAILPIDKLEGYIAGAIEKTMNVVNLEKLAYAIEDLANRPIQMNINGRQFAYATASDGDSVNGLRTTFKSRGLAVE